MHTSTTLEEVPLFYRNKLLDTACKAQRKPECVWSGLLLLGKVWGLIWCYLDVIFEFVSEWLRG